MKVVFTATDSIFGYAIRVGTKSSWNHVDMLFSDGTLIGSIGIKGVERLTLEDRLNDPRIKRYRVDEIILKDEYVARAFAEAQVGKPYDYKAIFAFTVPWRASWQSNRRWFCSELVAAVCEQGGTPIARQSMSRVTPAFLDYNPLLTTVKPTRYVR